MRGVLRAARTVAGVEVPGGRVGEHRDGGVVERDVAVTADPVSPGGVQTRHQAERGDIAATEIDKGETGFGGRTVGIAGEVHPPGQALQDVVVTGLLGPGTGHAEPGQTAADDGRVEVLEVVVGDLDLRRDVAAQVRVDRVAGADEIFEDLASAGGSEVQRQAALVAVEGLEEQRVLTLVVGRNVAPDVAAGGRLLDLEHVGTEVGEVDAAEGAGTVLLDGDDPDVLERPHRVTSADTGAVSSAREGPLTSGK